MISWIKGLFQEDQLSKDIGKVLEVKQAKGKNISEPVFAMLNAWKQNPKRFVMTMNLDISHIHTTSFYKSPYATLSVKDSMSGEEFIFGLWLKSDSWRDISSIMYHHMPWFSQHRIYPVLGASVSYKPSWMTQDELDFIIDTVKPHYLKRVNRYRDIVESRIDRTRKANELKSEIAKQKERDRLTGVYK